MRIAIHTRLGVCLILLLGVFGSENPTRAQDPPRPSNDRIAASADEPEVLDRGPVHEAFAQPVDLKPGPAMTAPKEPPRAIEELPPATKPEGGDSVWIRGYWSWDDERKDFVWVSGLWRIPPQGRQWIDGRWEKTDGNYQRASGYWAPMDSSDVSYLQEPPESLERGPNSAAPGANYFWAPGCWQWNNNRYAWQAGYWSRAYPGWTWTPNSYCWTPRGYAYVPGYWDYYPLNRRGWLFAPVYFGRNSGIGPGYSYRPNYVLDGSLLTLNLFVGPSFGNYYFGNYYGGAYANGGFSPWYRYSWNRPYYDPLFAYNQWYFGRYNPNWQAQLSQRHDSLARNNSGRDLWRPNDVDGARSSDRRDLDDARVARPVNEFARSSRGQLSNRQDGLESVVGRPPAAWERSDRSARNGNDRRGEQGRGDRTARGGKDRSPDGRQLEGAGGQSRQGGGRTRSDGDRPSGARRLESGAPKDAAPKGHKPQETQPGEPQSRGKGRADEGGRNEGSGRHGPRVP